LKYGVCKFCEPKLQGPATSKTFNPEAVKQWLFPIKKGGVQYAAAAFVNIDGKSYLIMNKHNIKPGMVCQTPSMEFPVPVEAVKWEFVGGDQARLDVNLHLKNRFVGLKPTAFLPVKNTEVGGACSFVGFDPVTGQFVFASGKYIIRDGQILHDITTQGGSCGMVLLDVRHNRLLGMHYANMQMCADYPNNAFPIQMENVKPRVISGQVKS